MNCPACGGDIEAIEDDTVIVCIAPGTCAWSCGGLDYACKREDCPVCNGGDSHYLKKHVVPQ